MYIIYSKEGCINCQRAKALLIAKGIEFEMKMANVDYELDYLRELGVRQLPYITKIVVTEIVHIGGLEELKRELFK